MILAFVVYFGLLLAMVGCWTIAARTTVLYPSREGAIDRQAVWFTIILFTFLIGFRYPLDGDFFGYIYYYQTTYLNDRPQDVVFEPGFLWLIQILKFFDAPDRSIIVASSFLQILLLTNWLKNKKKIAPFICYFFVAIVLFDIDNLIRQGIALFAMIIALDRLQNKKILNFIIYSSFAVLFHRSAIIIFPISMLIWRFKVPITYLQIIALLISYAFVNVFFEQVVTIFERLSPILGYDSYAETGRKDLAFEGVDSSLNLGRYLWPMIDGVIMLYSRSMAETYRKDGYRLYHAFFLVGALLQPVATAWDFVPFARALFYFTSMRMVCLGFLTRYCFFEGRSGKSIMLGLGICAIFAAWLIVAILRGAAGSAPYAFS